jgi:hypothetical protein
MHGAMLEAAGMVSGLAAYFVGRRALALRDIHRDALLAERRDALDGLLLPYAGAVAYVPSLEPVIDLTELPANVRALRSLPQS